MTNANTLSAGDVVLYRGREAVVVEHAPEFAGHPVVVLDAACALAALGPEYMQRERVKVLESGLQIVRRAA